MSCSYRAEVIVNDGFVEMVVAIEVKNLLELPRLIAAGVISHMIV